VSGAASGAAISDLGLRESAFVAFRPEPAQAEAVVTIGLTKRFRSGQVAVDGIDLHVPQGSIYGFLGPNGSGKTTTIRMLLGLIRPTAGSHELLGLPMPQAAARALPAVGSLVEGPAFHPYLSGRANLLRLDAADRTTERRTARRRVGEAFERVGLSAAADKRYRAYSLGMRQRLALAATLLRPRRLLILDEPTNGLDPQGTREVRALITELAAAGSTVMLSTHLLSEVEQICTHVGVMSTGRLVAQAPLEELRAGAAEQVRVETGRPDLAVEVLERLGLTEVRHDPQHVRARLGALRPEDVVRALVLADVPVAGFTCTRPDLEDVFVGLTGEGFDVSG
jgi:lantibiotic transport system ATP-binding protein